MKEAAKREEKGIAAGTISTKEDVKRYAGQLNNER